MRVYISVDMEGLAGVAHPAQTSFEERGDRTDYDRSRALMAGETNAAIAGALASGADEVVVNDSHWQMRNLRAEDLHPAARLIIGDKPYSMTTGIDGADAAAFIGYHAGAGHPTGVLGHTYAGRVVQEVRVNGAPHNEATLNALRLGARGVPVVLVSGDDALAGEVEAKLPWAERVVVKRALGTAVIDSLSPEQARREIEDGMCRALERLAEMKPYVLKGPLRLELDVRQPNMADFAEVVPGVRRIGPCTVRVEAADGEELYRWLLSLIRLATTPLPR